MHCIYIQYISMSIKTLTNPQQLLSSASEKVLNAIGLFRLQKNTALPTDNTETKETKTFMDADLPQNLLAAGWQ